MKKLLIVLLFATALTSCKKELAVQPSEQKVKVFIKVDAVDNQGAIMDTQITDLNY